MYHYINLGNDGKIDLSYIARFSNSVGSTGTVLLDSNPARSGDIRYDQNHPNTISEYIRLNGLIKISYGITQTIGGGDNADNIIQLPVRYNYFPAIVCQTYNDTSSTVDPSGLKYRNAQTVIPTAATYNSSNGVYYNDTFNIHTGNAESHRYFWVAIGT